MVYSLYLVILLLGTLQCGGTPSIQQEPLIQTAFANEQVNATCAATFSNKSEYSNIVICYYRIDSEGNKKVVYEADMSENIPAGFEPKQRIKFNLHIKPTNHNSVTGTYYCQARWGNRDTAKGDGTFTLFRDKGYIEPPLTIWLCLIVTTIILAVMSITGTALFFWKRKVVWPEWSRVKKCPAQGPEPEQPSGSSEPPGSIYTDLEPRPSSVYFVINKNEGNPSREKTPTAKVTHQEVQGEIYDIVYENL